MQSRFAQCACFIVLCGTLTAILAGCITPRPGIAPPAGVYNCPAMVTLSDARSDAAIYYTTDGSTPATSSTKYTGPFTISGSDKVQAIALAPGYKVSAVATIAYSCAPGVTLASFASTVQQRFNLPQPATPIHFADLAPGDPGYAGAQAIAPYLHRQILCQGCVLSANFFPNQALPRAGSAVFFVSYLMAQGKIELLSTADANAVLANVSDANAFSPLARRYLATAIKNGILPLHEGNALHGTTPLSPAEMTGVLQTMQNQFHVNAVAPQ
jgi:hypothetical protein